MQDLIKTFLRQAAELWHRAQLESIAGECLRLDAARNPRNTDAAKLLETNKHRNKAARELLATGRELATRLEAAGQDSTPLLTFLHTLDAAGGPEAAAPLWGPLKISLLTERNRSRNKAARERWLATREGLPHSGDLPPTANTGREWFNVASWPLYPFADRPQRLPPEKPPFTFNDMLAGKRYRPPEETNREGSLTPGGTVRLERAGVVVELYFPTDADQETLAAAMPGCNLDAPPWHAIQARLIAAGLSADWQGLTAPAAVAMLTRTATPTAATATPSIDATPGTTQGEGKDGRPQDGIAPAPGDATGTATNAETNRYAVLAKLPDSPRKAYFSFLYAEAANERRLDDREAWEWLQENGTDIAGAGELDGYDLPEFGTWARYLRRARKKMGEQKYTPRTK